MNGKKNVGYKDKIIEMVQNTDSQWLLKQILDFIENMTREGD